MKRTGEKVNQNEYTIYIKWVAGVGDGENYRHIILLRILHIGKLATFAPQDEQHD